MQRKGGRGKHGEEFDVEAVLDELYTTPPPGFVARREELAAAARTAGRAEDSRRIRAARRPTLAAWAANLLLRREPGDSRRLLELGEGLREAYRTLDPAALKDLSAQRRRIVAGLARQAARLAEEAGHRLSAAAQQEVSATLHAVLADPGAAQQWAAGRLTGALDPPSEFLSSGPDAATATARPRATRTADRPAKKPARAGTSPVPEDELAERRRVRQEQLAKARAAAEEAERRLRDRREEAAEAQESLTRAGDRRDEARREVEAAERRLHTAREALEEADRTGREAEERHRSATDARTAAEREARAAAQEVRRLEGRTRRGE